MRWIGRSAARVAIILIRFYQLVLSPMKLAIFGPGSGCRYRPTCSQYAIECFREFSPLRAAYLTMKRIFSCHPWGGSGYDPIPKKKVDGL